MELRCDMTKHTQDFLHKVFGNFNVSIQLFNKSNFWFYSKIEMNINSKQNYKASYVIIFKQLRNIFHISKKNYALLVGRKNVVPFYA